MTGPFSWLSPAEPDSGRTLAHGHRVIVKIDQAGQPARWSPWYREAFESLEVSP